MFACMYYIGNKSFPFLLEANNYNKQKEKRETLSEHYSLSVKYILSDFPPGKSSNLPLGNIEKLGQVLSLLGW